ncbi:MAG: hypothetical protein L6408_07440 [Nanoarchaeota archaeon]|nr:hypothetical protein [Nanoarchaeota archaeon]
MNRLNKDLILDKLIENIDKDRNKHQNIRKLLVWDYCYKKGEPLPNEYSAGLVSRVLERNLNQKSKSVVIDESNFLDRFFLWHYKKLLSKETKNLVKKAQTSKDYKAIIAIDTLAKKVKNSNMVVSSSASLDSKVFNLAKACEEVLFEQDIKKDYKNLKMNQLKVNSEIKKPLDNTLIKTLSNIKKELNKKSVYYSKYSNRQSTLEMQNLISNTQNLIDNKFKGYLADLNNSYNQIRITFDDNPWDKGKKINRLKDLKSDLKNIKSDYNLVSHRKGVNKCTALDAKMNSIIRDYEYIYDIKEDFKDSKIKLYNYKQELNDIFSKPMDNSKINTLNRIYSDLNLMHEQSFRDCTAKDLQDRYYSGVKKVIENVEDKCEKRIRYLAKQSEKYRNKFDNSWFSWNTKKYADVLRSYNKELEAWSRCRAI